MSTRHAIGALLFLLTGALTLAPLASAQDDEAAAAGEDAPLEEAAPAPPEEAGPTQHEELTDAARPVEGASGSGPEETPNPNNNIQSDNDEPVDSDPEPEVSSPPPAPSLPAASAGDAPAPTETERAAPEEAADEEDEAPARRGPALSFANSFFSYTNAVTLHTLAPAAQLSYDPTWLMNFSLTPRFYLTDTTFLWLNQAMSVELTDTNTGTYNREPLLTDTLLDLRQLLAVEGFVFQGQLRLAAPTSKASQAAGRVLQTGLGLTVARPFPELAGFTVAATVGYRRWWATRNVATTANAYPGNCTQPEPGQPPVCTQAGGQSSARDILLGGLTMSVAPAPGLTVSLSGFYLATYGHELAAADVPINGGSTTVEDESLTHWRPFTYVSLAVGYDVLPWLNLQLGIQNSGVVAPLYSPDGSVRSPFTADTQVFLTTTVGLDALYGEIAGSGEDESLTPDERQRRRQGLARGRTTTGAF